MKTNFKIFAKMIFIALLFVSANAYAGKGAKATIATSGKCDMCKSKIEKTLLDTKGVSYAYYNLANGSVKVKYDPAVTNIDGLRKAINMAGYDADSQPADKTAHDALPKCCQKGQVCTH